VLETTSAIDVMTTTLAGAIAANSPVAIAAALTPLFDTIDLDASGGITLAEMQAALAGAGLATDTNLQAIFDQLDANGNGVISQIEATNQALGGVAKDTTVSGVAKTGDLTNLTYLPGISTNTGGTKTGVDGVNTNLGGADGVKDWNKILAKGIVPFIVPILFRLTEHSKMLAALKDVKKAKIKPSSGVGLSKVGDKDYAINLNNAPIKDVNLGVNLSDIGYLGAATGGIIGRYAPGGIVGNGIWNRDSVLARYAGGGDIMLAGGEGVINAAATSMIGPSVIELMNRTGRVPMPDNGRHFDTQNRVLMAGFRAMVESNEALRVEVRRLRAATDGTTRAIERKPVARERTLLG
jgi:hypothetical protein